MDLAGFSRGVGFGFWMCHRFDVFAVVDPYRLDVFIAGRAGAAKRAEPIARERLFRTNLANVGAGPLRTLSWLGAMAGLVVALCRIDAGAGALVA